MMHRRLLVVTAALAAAPTSFADGPWFKWLLEREAPRYHTVSFGPSVSGDGRFAFVPANTSSMPPVSCDLLRIDLVSGEVLLAASWEWCDVSQWGTIPSPSGHRLYGVVALPAPPWHQFMWWTMDDGVAWDDGNGPLFIWHSQSGKSVFGFADQVTQPPDQRWIQQFDDGRVVVFEQPPGASRYGVRAISQDDSLAVGGVEYQNEDGLISKMVVWRDGRLVQLIEDPIRFQRVYAIQVDPKEGRIGGYGVRVDNAQLDSFVWSPEHGARPLGFFERQLPARAPLFSTDLNVCLWDQNSGYVPGAETSSFLWQRGLGVSSAADILRTEFEPEFDGAITIDISNISADGQTVVGVARFEGSDPCRGYNMVPFAAHIPFRMPGDVDRDFAVDGADLGLLLGAWGTGDDAADINGDGVVDGDDLGVVLAAWGNDGFE